MIETKTIFNTEHIDNDELMHIDGTTSDLALELEQIIYRVYQYILLKDKDKLVNFKRNLLYQVEIQYDLLINEVRRCKNNGTLDKLANSISKDINHDSWRER